MATTTSTMARASHVTVHIPAEVAFDLGKFQKVIANLGEKLGCQGCISGAACNFVLATDFLVDPATLAIKDIALQR